MSTADKIARIFAEIHDLTRQMNAIPGLDELGVPYDEDTPDGQAWVALLEKQTDLAMQACALAKNTQP